MGECGRVLSKTVVRGCFQTQRASKPALSSTPMHLRCGGTQIRPPVIDEMMTWQRDPELSFPVVLLLVKFLSLHMGVLQRGR